MHCDVSMPVQMRWGSFSTRKAPDTLSRRLPRISSTNFHRMLHLSVFSSMKRDHSLNKRLRQPTFASFNFTGMKYLKIAKDIRSRYGKLFDSFQWMKSIRQNNIPLLPHLSTVCTIIYTAEPERWQIFQLLRLSNNFTRSYSPADSIRTMFFLPFNTFSRTPSTSTAALSGLPGKKTTKKLNHCSISYKKCFKN